MAQRQSLGLIGRLPVHTLDRPGQLHTEPGPKEPLKLPEAFENSLLVGSDNDETGQNIQGEDLEKNQRRNGLLDKAVEPGLGNAEAELIIQGGCNRLENAARPGNELEYAAVICRTRLNSGNPRPVEVENEVEHDLDCQHCHDSEHDIGNYTIRLEESKLSQTHRHQSTHPENGAEHHVACPGAKRPPFLLASHARRIHGDQEQHKGHRHYEGEAHECS